TYSGLSSPVTAKHIHVDTYQAKNLQGQIVFDIDAATPEPDGSYIWNIVPSGPLSTADLVQIVKQGKSYLNVHTVNNPGGEINGHFTLANGASRFTPPPRPPAWTADPPNSSFSGPLTFNTWWKESVTAPDQLRQRVAFAQSEIMVISDQGILADNARALSSYYDLLLKDAFGNFRTLLRDVTLHPAMGLYLDMRR